MPPSSRHLSQSTGSIAVFLAIGACVLASRLWLIQVWGSPLPDWDHWDAEALQLYRPWLDGTFRWSQLFSAHNERQIALTRLANLALFVWTGEWRPWNQLILLVALTARRRNDEPHWHRGRFIGNAEAAAVRNWKSL